MEPTWAWQPIRCCGSYIDAHLDATVSSPTAQYNRLQAEARKIKAQAKDSRAAYDKLMKTFKALKKEVDAVLGDNK